MGSGASAKKTAQGADEKPVSAPAVKASTAPFNTELPEKPATQEQLNGKGQSTNGGKFQNDGLAETDTNRKQTDTKTQSAPAVKASTAPVNTELPKKPATQELNGKGQGTNGGKFQNDGLAETDTNRKQTDTKTQSASAVKASTAPVNTELPKNPATQELNGKGQRTNGGKFQNDGLAETDTKTESKGNSVKEGEARKEEQQDVPGAEGQRNGDVLTKDKTVSTRNRAEEMGVENEIRQYKSPNFKPSAAIRILNEGAGHVGTITPQPIRLVRTIVANAPAPTENSKTIEAKIQKITDLAEGAAQSVNHVTNCRDFPCSTCCVEIRKVANIAHDKSIDLDLASDEIATRTNLCQMLSSRFKVDELILVFGGPKENLNVQETRLFQFFNAGLGACWNFSDHSDIISLQLESTGCMKSFIQWLTLDRANPDMCKWGREVSYVILNIFNNAIRRVPSIRPKLYGDVPVIQQFAKGWLPDIGVMTGIMLAFLMPKDEADKFALNEACMDNLLSMLRKTLQGKDHTASFKRPSVNKGRISSFYITALELIQGVEQLVINDNNKVAFMKKGGVPLLAKMMEDGCSADEKKHAANIVWRLAFLKENKDILRENGVIMGQLTKYASSYEDVHLQNASMGALFEIYGSKLPQQLKSKQVETNVKKVRRVRQPASKSKASATTTTTTTPTNNDSSSTAQETVQDEEPEVEAPSAEEKRLSPRIMISYKWENPAKPVMREIKIQLVKLGYEVWMDEDHMMGDKIGAMTAAVENSELILACITRGYQDSQDCRTEATYAYECKKKIVPLKVDPTFVPKGWLGGIAAGKIYYVVKETKEVVSVLPTIIEKEFRVFGPQGGSIGVQDSTDGGATPMQSAAPPPPAVPARSPVADWSVSRVKEWLTSQSISTKSEALLSMNGMLLLQLKKQLATAPQSFYDCMKEDLKVEYMNVLTLAAALENLQ